ncbi:hypothetical protein [Aminicella lysinilytica]|uniref:tRNA nucleotidyltransferase/poly(A) polymerase n=1 Tax=Aminicella lysinilytica TaxID=433323 RepID=A0A4R6Q7W9_9FIRM|nr:hypothetical protein [Aminicella lysinilytica]TDP57916.1 tRNA nucleotidyltransferase/poly(A) polymerase [Aminicella lysinilytica]
MLKFDKDVLNALQALEKAGFETYAVGDCIIQWAKGMVPVDWDMVTKAGLEDMKKVFPDGEVIDEANSILRLDFTHEVEDDEETSHIEGAICDITTMEGTIQEELSNYGFTVAAIADNPERTVIDEYGGLEDIKKKLINTIGNADELFQEEPIRMMEAMRYVSDLGFDLQKDVYQAILKNWRLLLNHSIAPIRQELELVLTGEYTGKALNMMADTGLMAVIFGEEVSRKMNTGEMQQFMTLCKNIDKTKALRLRRLGLLYTVFNEKHGLEAIKRMNFDPETEAHLQDAMTEMVKIQFLSNSLEFKRYVCEHGLKRYNYVHMLAKAQRIVYDQPAIKIEARNHLMSEIKMNNEPVFVEDLVIDGNDIMEAGITDSPEQAEDLLYQVLAKAHQDPRNNDRTYLLKIAKKYSKNKFKAKSRYVHWMR